MTEAETVCGVAIFGLVRRDRDPDRIRRRASTSKSLWSPRKLFVAFLDLSAAHSPRNSAYGENIHMQTSYGGYAIDGIVAGKMSRRTNAG